MYVIVRYCYDNRKMMLVRKCALLKTNQNVYYVIFVVARCVTEKCVFYNFKNLVKIKIIVFRCDITITTVDYFLLS